VEGSPNAFTVTLTFRRNRSSLSVQRLLCSFFQSIYACRIIELNGSPQSVEDYGKMACNTLMATSGIRVGRVPECASSCEVFHRRDALMSLDNHVEIWTCRVVLSVASNSPAFCTFETSNGDRPIEAANSTRWKYHLIDQHTTARAHYGKLTNTAPIEGCSTLSQCCGEERLAT
jgi:hypothetical protein